VRFADDEPPAPPSHVTALRVPSQHPSGRFLTWCANRQLDPFTARRPHLELYLW